MQAYCKHEFARSCLVRLRVFMTYMEDSGRLMTQLDIKRPLMMVFPSNIHAFWCACSLHLNKQGPSGSQ